MARTSQTQTTDDSPRTIDLPMDADSLGRISRAMNAMASDFDDRRIEAEEQGATAAARVMKRKATVYHLDAKLYEGLQNVLLAEEDD